MRLIGLILLFGALFVAPSYADICGKPINKIFACPTNSPHAGEFYCDWALPCSHDGVDSFYKERTCLVPSVKSACPSFEACEAMPDCTSPKASERHSERDSDERPVQTCRPKTAAQSVCVWPPSGLRTWN